MLESHVDTYFIGNFIEQIHWYASTLSTRAITYLYRVVIIMQDVIMHIVPELSRDERACIMAHIMMRGYNRLYDVYMGNCTREYLLQYNYDPMPQIWREHNIASPVIPLVQRD